MKYFYLFQLTIFYNFIYGQAPQVFSFPKIPLTHYITSLSVVNDDIVWGIVNNEANNPTINAPMIVRTSNGGKSWKVDTLRIAGRVFYDIQALDSITAIITSNKLVSGDTRPIFKTSDGGLTWKTITPPGASGGVIIHFFNENEGLVYNNGSYSSSVDKGQTWTNLQQIPYNAGEFNGFIGCSTNFPFGNENFFIIGSTDGRIFKTNDKGKTFKTVQAAKTNEWINSITFFESLSGALIVTGTKSTDYSFSKVYVTVDGGYSWNYLYDLESFITSIHSYKNYSYTGSFDNPEGIKINKNRVTKDNWEVGIDSKLYFLGGQTSKYGVTYLAVQNDTLSSQIIKIQNVVTDIKEPNNIEVSVYPNPCADQLNIKADSRNLTYAIFDLEGRKKMSGALDIESINTTSLRNGIYFLALRDLESNETLFEKTFFVMR
jgi:hypothetical protein